MTDDPIIGFIRESSGTTWLRASDAPIDRPADLEDATASHPSRYVPRPSLQMLPSD